MQARGRISFTNAEFKPTSWGLRPKWNVGIMEHWNNGFWDNGLVD
jgi:hypothetical protein